MSSTTADLLQQIVEPVLRREGLDLEGLDVSQAGRRRRVRITVDADGGVDLDRCADVSRLISHAFDDTDVMGETPYILEVSSPGVSRPLTLPRHWRRAVGHLVRIVLAAGGTVEGRVRSAGPESAVISVADGSREIRYGEVAKARVQVEFRRTGLDLDAGPTEGA